MRSLLLVPGDAVGRLAASPAGALVFDLCATAAPSAAAAAREDVRAFVAAARRTPGQPRLFVRVNGFSSSLTEPDLAAVMPARPDGIVLPDTIGGRDLSRLGALLAVHEAEHGFEDGSTRIIATAASGAGLLGLGSLAGVSLRLVGIAWDALALRADLGGRAIRDEAGAYTDPYRVARALVLFAAAAARVMAIDTPDPECADPDSLGSQSRAAQRDGFAAKLALDQAQVPVIDAAFANARRRT